MKNLFYYRSLPEIMDKSSLREEIQILLCESEVANQLEYLESLYELSLRKENSDIVLDDDMNTMISNTIIELWNTNSEQSTVFCIMIIFNLELKEAFIFMKMKYKTIRKQSVKRELAEAFEDAKSGPPPLKNW